MPRLIDATALVKLVLEERDKIPLEVVERYSFGVPSPNKHGQAMRGGIRKVLRLIEQAPTLDYVPRQQWISVKDRLPEETERVLFVPTCNQGSVYIGQCAFVGRDGGVMFAHRDGRYKVNYYAKYWMPLPEAPKEDENA